MVDRLYSDPRLAALYNPWWSQEQRSDCADEERRERPSCAVFKTDFDFYLPLVMSAHAVLDAGCGTGALLHAARERGHTGRLCGLDPAIGMLALARQRPGIEWVLGTLASSHWARKFDLVVMTGHAFQVLVEDDEIRASLTAVRLALKKHGRFAFETRNPLARAWESWTPENAVEVAAAEGVTVRITTQVDTPFDGRIVSFTHTFTSPAWDQPQISSSTLRFLGADSLSSLLPEAGLVIEEQFGDWDRRPLTETSPEIITIARRA
jgi:SAM-dependent methyltransferase